MPDSNAARDVFYGFCPECGAPGVSRRRSLSFCEDTCVEGHTYAADKALSAREMYDRMTKMHETLQEIERRLSSIYPVRLTDDVSKRSGLRPGEVRFEGK